MSGVSPINISKYLYFDKNKKKACIKPNAPQWAKDEFAKREYHRSIEYVRSITVE